ncbi:Rpb4p [Malassezia vespertilionis]|uniref:Rpb4p n=1 Tax=Malassezia vespertilionis TaxID=2020962 RepID=A0A2N1JG05_9BASI|nr:Rpb4p [Malassezia vespertilionis]
MAQPAFLRRRHGNVEVEDAGKGQLGSEFQDAGCLLTSEVHLFFSRPADLAADRDASATAVAQKTKEYVNDFSRYKEQSTIREVRALLIKHAVLADTDEPEGKGLQLTQFEMAQLANLAVSDVDEARILIPTKDDAQLESLLNELSAIRKFS